MDAVTQLAPTVGVVAACDVLGVARASFYRQRPLLGRPHRRRPRSACRRLGRLPLAPSVRTNAPSVLRRAA